MQIRDLAGPRSEQAGESFRYLTFENCEGFYFGVNYGVCVKHGRSKYLLECNDLELLLRVMQDEYEAHPEWLPYMQMIDRLFDHSGVLRPKRDVQYGRNAETFASDDTGPGIRMADARYLSVTNAEPNGWLPPPPVGIVVRRVRELVTYYNLTGGWHLLEHANL